VGCGNHGQVISTYRQKIKGNFQPIRQGKKSSYFQIHFLL
jgi:Ca2+-binding EF-hand superfamily protein